MSELRGRVQDGNKKWSRPHLIWPTVIPRPPVSRPTFACPARGLDVTHPVTGSIHFPRCFSFLFSSIVPWAVSVAVDVFLSNIVYAPLITRNAITDGQPTNQPPRGQERQTRGVREDGSPDCATVVPVSVTETGPRW